MDDLFILLRYPPLSLSLSFFLSLSLSLSLSALSLFLSLPLSLSLSNKWKVRMEKNAKQFGKPKKTVKRCGVRNKYAANRTIKMAAHTKKIILFLLRNWEESGYFKMIRKMDFETSNILMANLHERNWDFTKRENHTKNIWIRLNCLVCET